MNSNPIGKNYAQLGLEAHQEMQDWRDNPDPEAPWPTLDESKSRGHSLLHHDGEMGHSSFKAGDVLVGPVEDQSLVRSMEKILEK